MYIVLYSASVSSVDSVIFYSVYSVVFSFIVFIVLEVHGERSCVLTLKVELIETIAVGKFIV